MNDLQDKNIIVTGASGGIVCISKISLALFQRQLDFKKIIKKTREPLRLSQNEEVGSKNETI